MDNLGGIAALKEGMRSTWMAGDFGRIARYSSGDAAEFVERLGIAGGSKVLDVACGTGNTAIPAARGGAQVTGVDIATNLLEQARERGRAEGVPASFEEADAEHLPFADGAFDVVVSMFGAMFAPRPELVAAELARVCRRGGTIAMANWTGLSFAGKMFALTVRHAPPPEGIPAAVLWGDEEVVRQRFGAGIEPVRMVRRSIETEFPFTPREVAQLFRDYFGPTHVAFARMNASQQAAFAEELENLWKEYNESKSGGTKIRNEYLEVVATRL